MTLKLIKLTELISKLFFQSSKYKHIKKKLQNITHQDSSLLQVFLTGNRVRCSLPTSYFLLTLSRTSDVINTTEAGIISTNIYNKKYEVKFMTEKQSNIFLIYNSQSEHGY